MKHKTLGQMVVNGRPINRRTRTELECLAARQHQSITSLYARLETVVGERDMNARALRAALESLTSAEGTVTRAAGVLKAKQDSLLDAVRELNVVRKEGVALCKELAASTEDLGTMEKELIAEQAHANRLFWWAIALAIFCAASGYTIGTVPVWWPVVKGWFA